MQNKFLGASLAGTLVVLALSGVPAFADPLPTSTFLSNLSPNINFVDRSSRLAITTSKDARIREFARSEAIDQTNTANAVYDWTLAKSGLSVAAADGPVQTGRSVAVDSTPVVDNRLPRGQEDLDALEGMEGKDFDARYLAAQRDALTQIAADYRDYVDNGSDEALKQLAARELPKVRHSLDILDKL